MKRWERQRLRDLEGREAFFRERAALRGFGVGIRDRAVAEMYLIEIDYWRMRARYSARWLKEHGLDKVDVDSYTRSFLNGVGVGNSVRVLRYIKKHWYSGKSGTRFVVDGNKVCRIIDEGK